MSAPDPVAALREYVRAEGSQRHTGSHAEGALLNEAPRLLTYVEQLEAALVAFAQAIDDGAATISRPCLCDESVGITECETCDATIEAHTRELVAEQAMLALGREIAGRKP